jgi:hypothetical protein
VELVENLTKALIRITNKTSWTSSLISMRVERCLEVQQSHRLPTQP